MMKRFVAVILFSLGFFAIAAENSVLFKFKHKKGDSVSHVSTVSEEAYINGYRVNYTRFVNRTSTTVVDVFENEDAQLNTKYMTTQETNSSFGSSYKLDEEDYVNIKRTTSGMLYDSDNAFLPTVRNVPSFPDYPVKIGESWNSKGLEVHDCRQLFKMTDAIEIPFTATYTYVGDDNSSGSALQIIEVYYELNDESYRKNSYRNSTYLKTLGYAKQKLFWDNEKGELSHYEEEFEIKMYDIKRNEYLYHGISQGEVIEYHSVNDDKNIKKVQDSVEKMKLDNVSVKRGEKGLTISLDAIQFEPDSNILRASEKKKLEKIAEILKEFSNDLLITGHCADRGSEKSRKLLSEQRAYSVANYLESLGVRDKKHIYTQGKGSSEAVASNATEEGRAKNRRVEITIMD
jgi:outer membrane protein tpn50